MANRVDLLLQSMLGNRWIANQQTTAATVSVASPTPAGQQRAHVETLIYSIKNMKGAGAIIHTTTVQLRCASLGGTVIFATDHLVAPSTSANVAISSMGWPGKRGTAIVATMDTFIASVWASVSMAGWIEDTNG